MRNVCTTKVAGCKTQHKFRLRHFLSNRLSHLIMVDKTVKRDKQSILVFLRHKQYLFYFKKSWSMFRNDTRYDLDMIGEEM